MWLVMLGPWMDYDSLMLDSITGPLHKIASDLIDAVDGNVDLSAGGGSIRGPGQGVEDNDMSCETTQDCSLTDPESTDKGRDMLSRASKRV